MSIYVEWAKEVIELYVKEGKIAENKKLKANELMMEKAACFVSIHLKNKNLRGCIGTIAPREETLYEEIRNNAISASTEDPRFYPIDISELNNLVINIDILGTIYKLKDFGILNPEKYGVIVEKGRQRGLLLPNLEGVDTVERQLEIAKEKAGLTGYTNNEIEISYFSVTRYY